MLHRHQRLQHEVLTPTFALTLAGYASLAAFAFRHQPGSDVAAFACLGLTAGGVAMALDAEVRRNGEEWGWRGLYRSFRKRPSREFMTAFGAHLPQMITAAWIAWHWRKHR
jgi:predicted PhzF superfamily epimerase YddE/YHI9